MKRLGFKWLMEKQDFAFRGCLHLSANVIEQELCVI